MLGAIEMGDVLAADPDRAVGRLEQPQQRAADRRLAAAALAHQPQRLAAADAERHAVDGIDLARDACENTPLWIGKCFLRSLTSSSGALDAARSRQQLVGVPAGDPVAGPVLAPAAARSLRHWSVAKPQRGAKLQPCGRLNSDGTMPLISFSRVRRVPLRAAASRCGIEPSRPLV